MEKFFFIFVDIAIFYGMAVAFFQSSFNQNILFKMSWTLFKLDHVIGHILTKLAMILSFPSGTRQFFLSTILIDVKA